jgi:hypothetical protein
LEVVIKNKFEILGDITKIFISKRDGQIFEVLVDTDIYYEKLKDLDISWIAGFDETTGNYYVRYTTYCAKGSEEKDDRKTIYLHRYITDADETISVDHYDHNSLNNLMSNLRITKFSNNSKNRNGANSNNKSGYRNVCWSKSYKKWIVQLQIDGKNNMFKEMFDTAEEANEFAIEMRKKYYGEFAGF